MCGCNNTVSNRTVQARAFATVGLFRKISETVPADLACIYVLTHQQPDIHLAVSKLIDDQANDKNIINDYVESSGIAQMAKDYLARQFWKNIKFITSPSCMKLRLSDGTRVRLFPRDLLRAIDGMYISPSSKLWNIRHQIRTLHSLAVREMSECDRWDISHQSINGTQLEAIHQRELNVMHSFHMALCEYGLSSVGKQHIPNSSEKDLLLDLIESMLVMFGPYDYMTNCASRQIYEYCRLNDDDSIHKTHFHCHAIKCRTGRYCNTNAIYGFSSWSDGVYAAVSKLQNISPEAALCAGNICNVFSSKICSIPDQFLERHNPCPSREVAMYLKSELTLQREKMKLADSENSNRIYCTCDEEEC